MKKRKATILLTIASNLPTKDSMLGLISAITERPKKNDPNTIRPAKPTLPDLYQLNRL